MNMENLENQQANHHKKSKHGPSSYWMQDNDPIFERINLKEGDCFVDLGCGTGDYTIHASKITGDSGMVYALDKWEEMIDNLAETVKNRDIGNIKPILCDIAGELPLEDNCADAALVATVLHHSFNPLEKGETMFREVSRILKPGGRLFIIECKKENTPYGPPIEKRLSPTEIEGYASQLDFRQRSYMDLGNNYMLELSTL